LEAHTWSGGSTGHTFADLLLGRTSYYQEQTKNALPNIAWNRWEAYVNDSWKMKPSLTLTYGVRLSKLAPWEDREGIGLAAFDIKRYDPTAPASSFSGVVWNARDSSIPLSAVESSMPFQPRVGFAWDVHGTGETVVRGGAGIYFYHEPQDIYASLVDFGAGVRSFTQDNGPQVPIKSFEGLGGGALTGGNTIDIHDDKQPRTYSWSLTVNKKLPWSMNLEAGYVGNTSRNLLNNNVSNYNAVRTDGTRPLVTYGDLQVFRHSMYQNYHGLQGLLARQRGSFNFTLAYTFSKNLGFRSGIGDAQSIGSEYLFPGTYRDVAYGVLSSDRTHVASAAYSWNIPGPKTGGAKEALLGGWQVAGITSYVSGAPLPVVNDSNFNLQGTLADGSNISSQLITGSSQIRVQPVLTCDPRDNVPSGYLFNNSCFAAPSPGHNGNYVLPYMKAQSFWNVDLSLFKNFSVGGNKKLQLRASGYNVLNHPFSYPDNGTNLTLKFDHGQLANPQDFGRLPEDNKFGRRIVQLALRFPF